MDTETIISAIHRSPHRGVFACTGGGSRLISDLLCVPGASRTVLEAAIPYSAEAMKAFLHTAEPAKCAEITARQMAVAAWQRATNYADKEGWEDLFGFSCTATLATDRPHRGEHRVFFAFHSSAKTASLSVFLKKGTRSRDAEETLTAAIGLRFLAHVLGILPMAAGNEAQRSDRIEVGNCSEVLSGHCAGASFSAVVAELLAPDETLSLREFTPPAAWRKLFMPRKTAVCVRLPSREEILPPPQISALFPGSFAPFHHGHAHMMACAKEILGTEIALELAVTNVDKPALDYLEIDARLAQIAEELGEATVFLTNLPLFRQKAAFFPHTTFVVGADTMSRIADPRYSHRNVKEFARSMRFLEKQDDRFLVFGREADGKFCTLEDIRLPAALAEICTGVSEAGFRDDVSSTRIRNGNHE